MNIFVVSCNFNSGSACLKNMASVQAQTKQPKTHFFIDDASNDDTHEHLEKMRLVNRHGNIHLYKNTQRRYKIRNMHNLIENTNEIQDEDIICVLDGDDWFSDPYVLQYIYDKYDRDDFVYGYTNWTYSHDTSIRGCSSRIPNKNWNPYSSIWITSAMSTFKAGIFRNINPDNFRDSDGNWFHMACDQAYVLPILYSLKQTDGDYRRVFFIDEPMYIYNFFDNPSRPRYGAEGQELTKTASDCEKVIRARGFIP